MDTFAVVNQSSDPSLSRDVLLKMLAALQTQSERDFAPLWHQTPSTFVLAPADEPPTFDCHITYIKDQTPEAPDALAWHTIDEQGRPVLVVGLEACLAEAMAEGKSLLDVLSGAISHEACEERGNEFVNLNVDMPDGHHDTAREACDWVQGDAYEIDGFEMSNFVLPVFFDADAPEGTRLDYLSLCRKPLVVRPKGYAVLRSVRDGSSRMIFGESVSEAKREQKRNALVRGHHRLGETSPIEG